MEKKADISIEMKDSIHKFLDDCIKAMYKGHDHIIARKYYQDLFNELIPKYFCVCNENQSGSECEQ